MKIKTGDKIRVIAGKDKGKEGAVLQVFRNEQRLVIEGVNLATRHLRARSAEAPGQKVSFPSPMHVSKVMLIAPSGKMGRVGYKVVKTDGVSKKVRTVRSKGTVEEIG